MKIPKGVFQVRNTGNDKIFVSSSTNLNGIWNRMKFELNMGKHRNKALQADWKMFGEAQFKYEILSELEETEGETNHRAGLKVLEEMILEELKPFGDNGYNM